MSDMTKESLDVLEDWLKADKSINPKDAPRLQKLLADTPIKDVIALVERHNAVRAALALRLLPRQRSIEVLMRWTQRIRQTSLMSWVIQKSLNSSMN